MNYFGFWSSFYELLDPDPDPGGKFNADPCGSGYGSGSETLLTGISSIPEYGNPLSPLPRKMALRCHVLEN